MSSLSTHFRHKHSTWPFSSILSNSNRKKQRLDSIEKILDRKLSPQKLKKSIINNINLFYKYSDDQNTNQQQNTKQDNLYNDCIKNQTNIGWDHFIRGRITSSFLPLVANYYKTNKVYQRYSARNWIKILITNLLSIHNNAWQSLCSNIHKLNVETKLSLANDTLLRLVTKYYEHSVTLPRPKRKWFSRQLEQFNKWSNSDLKNGYEQLKE